MATIGKLEKNRTGCLSNLWRMYVRGPFKFRRNYIEKRLYDIQSFEIQHLQITKRQKKRGGGNNHRSMRNKSGFLATGSDEALHKEFFGSKCLLMMQ